PLHWIVNPVITSSTGIPYFKPTCRSELISSSLVVLGSCRSKDSISISSSLSNGSLHCPAFSLLFGSKSHIVYFVVHTKEENCKDQMRGRAFCFAFALSPLHGDAMTTYWLSLPRNDHMAPPSF
ncbi:hypothetical protein Dimus_012802, partial [Dionaea muscipula]